MEKKKELKMPTSLKFGYIVLAGLLASAVCQIFSAPAQQQQIFEEAKATILENEGNKSFMAITTKDGQKMTIETKQKIINFAGEHGLSSTPMDDNKSILFEKKE